MPSAPTHSLGSPRATQHRWPHGRTPWGRGRGEGPWAPKATPLGGVVAGPWGRLLQAQGVPTPTGMSLTGVGVAFPRSGFGSAVSWYSAILHPVSAVIAAVSKLACVPYVTAVWGTSQSSSSPQSFVELLTPKRDERGANPFPTVGVPPLLPLPCSLAGGTRGAAPFPQISVPAGLRTRKVAPRGPCPHQGLSSSS